MRSRKNKKNKNIILQIIFLSSLSIFVLFILIVGFSIHQEAQLPENLPEVIVEEGIPKFDLSHIEFFLKGLKLYKLHGNLFDLEPAKVKVVVAGSNQIFYVTITSNLFKVSDVELFDDPDLIIYLEGDTLLKVIKSIDNYALIEKLIDQGDIRLNYNSNKFTLFMKGFYATYLRP
ncbi:MAG: hypothetical protein PWP03_304 [Candidatus Woesearchaeota archaeon]|nr:hypothetical protein [Candidatus Woesearchaeota archaeon]MDN5327666.1 hypothetical protein [Candidatus Woesearchaeota archaeon]